MADMIQNNEALDDSQLDEVTGGLSLHANGIVGGNGADQRGSTGPLARESNHRQGVDARSGQGPVRSQKGAIVRNNKLLKSSTPAGRESEKNRM